MMNTIHKDEFADGIKHAYARSRLSLSTVSDRLAVIAYRKETISRDELHRLQQQLIEVEQILCVHTVGCAGALPEECEDADVYSDCTPVCSLVRDSTVTSHPTPGGYLEGDIWDRAPGIEVIIAEPPHKRPSTPLDGH